MNKTVPLRGFGGGGALLNFNVVGGTAEPAYPRDNIIWIKTGNKITSWFFSVTEPPMPEEGMVWIKTGTSAPASFDALKKNGIQICPLSAAQYIAGSWTDKTATSFQNGAWVSWATYLYNKGDFCESLTAGWEATQYARTSGHVDSAPGVTVGETDVTLQMGGMYWANGKNNHCSGTYFTADAIDVTGFSALKINVTKFTGGGAPRDIAYIGVTSAKKDAYEKVAEVSFNTVGVASLNVSEVTGPMFVYIALDIPSNTLSFTFDSVYLE